jgi:aspartyl-tRNA(Asn)/glutamyl-tRNA(Gln) amidotransferase subunit A
MEGDAAPEAARPLAPPPWRRSALELRAAYARRELTPLDALDALAQRIAALDPGLNAFAALCLERARAEAEVATQAFRDGTARPLEGVPFAAKDVFDSAGVVTTYGSSLFRTHVPDTDAAAVALLREAGAILVGKTATHEFAWGVTTVNPHYGPTRNPWDRERVVGGSSGGSGAAVAAGLVPLALGTDTGGSIRTPAAFCGVVGIKPTYGAVPLDGVMPLAPTLDHVGAIARTPQDAALMLTTLGGRPCTPASRAALRGLRAGYLDADDPDVAAILAALGGVDAVPVRVTLPPEEELLAAFFDVQRAEVAQTHRLRRLFPEQRDGYGDDVAERLERAQEVDLPAYLAATALRERLRGELSRVLADVDLLVLPLAPMTPPTIASVLEHGDEVLRQRIVPTTVLANLLGLPACAVRTRFDELDMPRAAQVVGGPASEQLLLGVARTVGEALPDVWERWPQETVTEREDAG